jgi:hypothetical protein
MWPYAPALVVFLGALVAGGGALWQAIRQSEFSAEIREKNETIIRLQNENIAQLTGSDSFCYVDVTFSARNAITFTLRHSGPYTVPEVIVQLDTSNNRVLAESFEAHWWADGVWGRSPLQRAAGRVVSCALQGAPVTLARFADRARPDE